MREIGAYNDIWTVATILIGGVATLSIFSFLIKENRFFRFFEHVYIGIAAGLGVVVTLKNFLWPKIFVPLLGLDLVRFPDGTSANMYDRSLLLYLAPMLLGLLYYFIYSKKYSWLSKLVIGVSLGASGGLAFQGFFNQMLPQLASSFKPLLVVEEGSWNIWQSFNNSFFVFTLLCVMYYFFFSFRRKAKSLEKLSLAGRWLMMICFGAYFGSTVMARMALLVERLQFLLGDWRQALLFLIVGG